MRGWQGLSDGAGQRSLAARDRPLPLESMAARSGNGVSGRSVIGGSVAEGFEPVRAVFESNFRDRDELGASVALYRGPEPLVDLWGGYRDVAGTRPWERDTMVLVYSTSKGLAGLAVAVAHSRELLDFEERVATYWPEFAQHGKGAITVRQLLSHQAGLPAVDERLDAGVMADLDRMASILAGQRPAWEPGTRRGYHGLSLGWYENELIRRVDPAHRSLGRFFHDELAVPLGLDFHIGLPADTSESRVAEIDGFTALQMVLHLNVMPAGMVLAYMWSGVTGGSNDGQPQAAEPRGHQPTGVPQGGVAGGQWDRNGPEHRQGVRGVRSRGGPWGSGRRRCGRWRSRPRRRLAARGT